MYSQSTRAEGDLTVDVSTVASIFGSLLTKNQKAVLLRLMSTAGRSIVLLKHEC